MELDIISYKDLVSGQDAAKKKLEMALLGKGIVGIRDVPEFEKITRAFIDAARKFSMLESGIKQQYLPVRDAGDTEGYELGAEWFKNEKNEWQIDDKKASFYAYVPDHVKNLWPREVDLKTPYLALGDLIFKTVKKLLEVMNLDESAGLPHESLMGYGRMLHYHKESDATNANPHWCGEHLDHGVFTGLAPAYYFRDGKEVDEPEEAGLYIKPNDCDHFEKIFVPDKSILLFQAGEFGQLASNDRIKATRHYVKKAKGDIERFTYALFYIATEDVIIKSHSILTRDARYIQHQSVDGSISYVKWAAVSYERYRVQTIPEASTN